MASPQQLTLYNGRRCTKVRRAVTAVAGNSTGKPPDTTSAPSPTKKTKSVYAPITNTPASAVAVPLLPSHAQAPDESSAAPPVVVATPAPPETPPVSHANNAPSQTAAPPAQVTPPPPPPPPPPAATAAPSQNTHVVAAPVPSDPAPANSGGGSSGPSGSNGSAGSGGSNGSGGGSGSDGSNGSGSNSGSGGSNGSGGNSGAASGGGSSGGSGGAPGGGSGGGSGGSDSGSNAGSSGNGAGGGNGAGSGNSGGSGSGTRNGGSGSGIAAPGAAINPNRQSSVTASSVVITAGALPGKGSAIPMSLGGSPIIISKQGGHPTESIVPVPIVFSTDGTLLTSTIMAPTGVPLSLGGKGSLIPVQTAGFDTPTSVASNGATNGPVPDTSNPGPNKGVIAGVVTGVLAIAILSALFFVCIRRALRKRDNRNSAISAGLAEPKSPSHIWGFFGKRKSKESDTTLRSSTPALERGERASMHRSDSFSRQRASSEPASRRLNVARSTEATHFMPPAIETHRRSVSSVAGLAYPVISETNDPFRDPDQNEALHIVNTTPGATPRAQNAASYAPQTPPYPLLTPFFNNPKLSPVPGALGVQRPPPPPPPQGISQRISNPFADPTSNPAVDGGYEDPFVDPRPYSSEYSSPTSSTNSPPYRGHNRTRTLAAVAGMPKITRTAPSVASTTTLHGRQWGSQDSGSISMPSADVSPHMSQLSRFPSNPGVGLGIERSISNSSSYKPQHRRMPSNSSAPRSSAMSGRLGSLAPFSTNPDTRLLTIPSPGNLTPHQETSASSPSKRLSESSEASSSLSLAFPSSWGEPGPTRPPSVAARSTRSGGSSSEKGGPASGSSAAGSRVSDPFDLEMPDHLTYPGSEIGSVRGYDSRSGSGASLRRGSEAEHVQNGARSQNMH